MKAVKWVALLLLMVLLIVFLFQNYEAFLSATTLELRLPALPPLASKPIPLYGFSNLQSSICNLQSAIDNPRSTMYLFFWQMLVYSQKIFVR